MQMHRITRLIRAIFLLAWPSFLLVWASFLLDWASCSSLFREHKQYVCMDFFSSTCLISQLEANEWLWCQDLRLCCSVPLCSWYKQVIVLHLEANTLTSKWQMLTLIMCLCVRARWSLPFTKSISSWLTKFIFEQITNNACTNTLMLVVNNLGSAFYITEWLWYQILRLWCSTTSQRTNTFSRYIRIQWLWDQYLRFCR